MYCTSFKSPNDGPFPILLVKTLAALLSMLHRTTYAKNYHCLLSTYLLGVLKQRAIAVCTSLFYHEDLLKKNTCFFLQRICKYSTDNQYLFNCPSDPNLTMNMLGIGTAFLLYSRKYTMVVQKSIKINT